MAVVANPELNQLVVSLKQWPNEFYLFLQTDVAIVGFTFKTAWRISHALINTPPLPSLT